VALLAAARHVAGSLATIAAQMLLFHAPAIIAGGGGAQVRASRNAIGSARSGDHGLIARRRRCSPAIWRCAELGGQPAVCHGRAARRLADHCRAGCCWLGAVTNRLIPRDRPPSGH
jgi:hypothetical protein